MSGSKYAMPIIVINMGGEMMYILNQRLQAQSISDEKAKKVLQDVVKAMFSPMFIEELFKPQDMYSVTSTKQIFEKLAHSSIMRLNKSSMDKLYDLMMMGFKYQALQCHSPQQLLHVTLNHLESIKDLIDSEEVAPLVQVAINNMIQIYATFSQGQWFMLRQSLMRYFQGKRVKVSLFLQNHMQAMDGTIVLDSNGKLPFGAETPGTVKFFEGGSFVRSHDFPSEYRYNVSECAHIIDAESVLGKNMYSKEFRPDVKYGPELSSSVKADRNISAFWGVASDVSKTSVASSVAASGPSSTSRNSAGAKAELNLLADLLGIRDSSSKASSSESKGFRINLFPDLNMDSKDGESKSDNYLLSFDIDATADAKTLQSYLEELDLTDEPKAMAKGGDDDDDLLSLMDSAK